MSLPVRPRVSARPWRLVLVAAIAACAACDGAERRDAEVVVSAVGRFRTADNAAIPAMLDALRATPCTAPEACKTRDECVAIGEPTAKALRLKHEVERSITAVEKGTVPKESPEAHGLAEKLDEASRLLKEGHEGLPRCDELVQALKRKHRI